MAYYKDLSLYEYGSSTTGEENTLNIGWLEDRNPVNRGMVTDEFVYRLWDYIVYNVVPMRGFHTNIEMDHGNYFMARYQGYEIPLGSSEIRVLGTDGKLYAAPNLILHYIINHNYLPPDCFIDAVLHGPRPNEDEYCLRLQSIVAKNSYSRDEWNCPYCGSDKASFGAKYNSKDSSATIKIIEYNFFNRIDRDTDDFVSQVNSRDMICGCCGKLISGNSLFMW